MNQRPRWSELFSVVFTGGWKFRHIRKARRLQRRTLKITAVLLSGIVGILLLVVVLRNGNHFVDEPLPSVNGAVSSESNDTPGPDGGESALAEKSTAPIRFSDVTPQTGINFRYYGSPSPEHYMTEQNGGGVALFDFDRDGRLDAFFVNGSDFKNPAEGVGASNCLYRETGLLRFADVTELAGLTDFGFGMGCAAADYDNDGFIDLYVSSFGRDRLWHNNGDGTFLDVTDEAGIENDLWGTSAAFCDLDGDGNLDLYVVNYVDWSPEEAPCFSSGDNPVRVVCSPTGRTGQPDVLFRNLGQREFEEIGSSAGIAIGVEGKGLALAIADFNSDNRPDIYVANDTTPNFLFQNQGNMKFRDVGVAHGVSCSDTGEVGAGMGVSSADIDGDGRLDLCVTNFRHQVDDIFLNIGASGFIAANAELGVDRVSRMKLGFGVLLQDFDLDGWPDLFVANGHIWDLSSVNELSSYQMLPTLLHNHLGQRFVDVAPDAGTYFSSSHIGRAVAAGDLDNDGDVDLVVTQLIESAAILRNDSVASGRVLRVRMIGRTSARQPLGMRVEAYSGLKRYVSCVPSGQSFQASHDERLCFAVGDAATVDRVDVFWGIGQVESWYDLPVDKDLSLVQSTGSSRTED